MMNFLLDVIAAPMILLGLWPLWVVVLIVIVVAVTVAVARRKKKK